MTAVDAGGQPIRRRDIVTHDGVAKRVTAVGHSRVSVIAGGRIETVDGTSCTIIERGGDL